MKLTNVTAILKANAVKVLAATALAGALLTAAPAAQAQHFGVGVRIGGPAYYGPHYYAPPPRPFYGYGYGYRPGFHAPYGYGYDWHYHHIDRWGHRW